MVCHRVSDLPERGEIQYSADESVQSWVLGPWTLSRPGHRRRDCREDDVALDLLSHVSDLRIWFSGCPLPPHAEAEGEDGAGETE